MYFFIYQFLYVYMCLCVYVVYVDTLPHGSVPSPEEGVSALLCPSPPITLK